MNGVSDYYRTRIKRLIRQHFDHEAQVPLEELLYHIQYIESQLPDVPYPSIQVAQESDFRWNEETIQHELGQIWTEESGRLAEKHLSRSALDRYRKLDQAEANRLVVRYTEAWKGRKGKAGCGIDAALRHYRALEAQQKVQAKELAPAFANRHGQQVQGGLCSTCASRLSCYASSSDKTRCNDYGQMGKAPQSAANGARSASKPRPRPNTAPFLRVGGI